MTKPPLPVVVVTDLPEWLTGVVVPIGAAVVAALIVVAGLALDARRRNQLRRAAFVDELTQLLIANAKSRHLYATNEDDVIREGMAANQFRVRAIAQMRRREFPIYHFASRTAGPVLNGEELVPQGATALAITHLLEWLTGERKTRDFPKPPPPEIVSYSSE